MAKRRPKKPPKTAGMQPPSGVVVQYTGALNRLLRRLQDELDISLRVEIEHLASELASFKASNTFLQKLQSIRDRQYIDSELLALTHEIAERVTRKNAREFKRVFGLKIREIEPEIDTKIVQFRNRNVDLIKSLTREQIDDFRNVLDVELERGTHATEIRKVVQERYGVSRSRAALLARDQVLKLNGQLTQTRQVSAGVREYIWTTSRDERVRPRHAALNGTVQSWSSPPVVDLATGRRAHPGEDYQCRCIAVPKLEEVTPEDETLFQNAVISMNRERT